MAVEIPEVSRLGFELESYTFLLLLKGDRYDDIDPETAGALNTEHLKHTLGQREAGHVLAAGALRTDAETAVRGLGFYRVPPDEARRMSEDDPAIRAGMYRVETYTFLGPKDGLAFPLAAGPPEPAGPAGPA
jgi:hypothetical protein